MAESLPKPTKKVTTITRIEETYEDVNENSPSGNPPPYSKNPTDPPDDPYDPYKPMEKKLTGPLAEASLPSLFDIFPLIGTIHILHQQLNEPKVLLPIRHSLWTLGVIIK